MKSYTDIEQSKKLAEILPMESSDMCYLQENGQAKTISPSKLSEILNVSKPQVIPSWSLVALLEVLPNNKHIETTISRGGWKIEPIEYLSNTWWCEYEDSESLTEFNTSADNPVDACVEMIVKLNELKIL